MTEYERIELHAYVCAMLNLAHMCDVVSVLAFLIVVTSQVFESRDSKNNSNARAKHICQGNTKELYF